MLTTNLLDKRARREGSARTTPHIIPPDTVTPSLNLIIPHHQHHRHALLQHKKNSSSECQIEITTSYPSIRPVTSECLSARSLNVERDENKTKKITKSSLSWEGNEVESDKSAIWNTQTHQSSFKIEFFGFPSSTLRFELWNIFKSSDDIILVKNDRR